MGKGDLKGNGKSQEFLGGGKARPAGNTQSIRHAHGVGPGRSPWQGAQRRQTPWLTRPSRAHSIRCSKARSAVNSGSISKGRNAAAAY
ncbi:MAG: hypothetical protein AAF756_14565, partial [Pseudomonadota bacterium]